MNYARKDGLVLSGLACALAMTLGASCSDPPAPVERPQRATYVEVAPASRGTITETLELHAEIEPRTSTTIAAGASGGKAEAVIVDEGDRVGAGDVLVRLSAAVAEARLQQAKATYHAAKKASERTTALRDRDLASPAAMDQAESALRQADAGLQLARAQYDDAVVRSPHDGVVAKRFISLGEQAMPGRPLFEVVDLSVVKVLAQLPERDLPYVHVGSTVDIVVDAWPDERFEGKIHRLGVVAAAFSRTFDLELQVHNRDGKLRAGMLARARIKRRELHDVITIRRDAVVQDERGSAVFVVSDGDVARRVPVDLGPTEGQRVAILTGLREGQLVVVVGQRMVVDGEAVQVVDAKQGSNPVAERVATPTPNDPGEASARP